MSEEAMKEDAEFGEVGTEKPVTSFFLACECKPGTPTFAILDPFVYDVQPAWTNGSLGVLHYDPPVYGIITTHEDGDAILGYVMTISHPDTVALLDRMKGSYGPEGFNTHTRNLVPVNLSDGREILAWVYVVSTGVISSYESIEQIENGMWDGNDKKLLELEQQLGMDEEDEDSEDSDDEEEGGENESIS